MKPEINIYTDKHGNVHKYVGSIFDYHNAHIMALSMNEHQERLDQERLEEEE
jgi:hypothetical protein